MTDVRETQTTAESERQTQREDGIEGEGSRWWTEPGRYTLDACASVVDCRLRTTFDVSATW